MRSSLLRRGLAAGAALAAGIAVLSVAPPAAHAQSPNGTTTWPAADTMLMAAGSDTTQNMMNDILAAHDGETDYDGTGVLHTYNLAAIPSGTVQVDGGTDCPQHAWNPGSLVYTPPPAQWTAPSGSSAGRDYLKAQEGYAAGEKGCVDIARSSGSPRTTANGDLPTYEYYAYALDDVTWATPSLKAPANLSRQNIQDIYSCAITNWGDPHLGTPTPATTPLTGSSGGANGPIQRYLPQNGSGTRSFFLSAFGITSGMLSNTNANCPAVKVTTSIPAANTPFEENRGDRIDYADIETAILPYSAAVWNYQYGNKLNPTLDLRNGVRLGGFVTNPASGTPTKALPVLYNSVAKRYRLDPAVVNESHIVDSGNTCAVAADCFNGVRYVYNVLDNAGNLPGYQAAFSLVGFTNAAVPVTQPLCNGSHVAEISSNFFLPLGTNNTPNNSNLAGSTCRRIPTIAT